MKTIYVVDEKDRVIPSANIPPAYAGAAVHVALSDEFVTVPQILWRFAIACGTVSSNLQQADATFREQ